MAEPIIEVKGLWTQFGTHVVHRNINLTVYRGEIIEQKQRRGALLTALWRGAPHHHAPLRQARAL